MVARGAGDVGCAHCTVIGAVEMCQVCTRLVCKTCGADWTTCNEPIGREVRLGRTARLRDVDPSGRIGLVSRLVGAYKLFDVRRLRWVTAVLPNPQLHGFVERVTTSGDLYEPVFASTNDGSTNHYYSQMRRRPLVGGEPTIIECPMPHLHMTVSASGHYTYVSENQLAVVIGPDGVANLYEPLPRKVLQGLSYDVTASAMAAATWGTVVIHRVVGDKLQLCGGVDTTGNASWVLFEEPWLAACVGMTIHVWHVGANFSIGREAYTHRVKHEGTMAALSRDGQYLAFSDGKKVFVHDLEKDVVAELEGHTDDICLVRFVGGDHLLVTADTDNRVIVRPRTPNGYLRDTIEIDVPDAEVALVLDDELAPR